MVKALVLFRVKAFLHWGCSRVLRQGCYVGYGMWADRDAMPCTYVAHAFGVNSKIAGGGRAGQGRVPCYIACYIPCYICRMLAVTYCGCLWGSHNITAASVGVSAIRGL